MIFWNGTIPGDMFIDTANSKKMMTGSHVTEQHTHNYQGPVSTELLNVTPKKPQKCDLLQNYQLDSPNKFKDMNIVSKTNNVTYTTGTDFLINGSQDYYNQCDQQYIACKYDDGLE